MDLDLATLALADGHARLTPAPVALPAQTSLAQNEPDRIGTHERQAIRGAAQRPVQGRQRPGGCPVALAIRRSLEFAQDARLGGRVIHDSRSTSVAWLERRQPLAIKQTDQRRHRVARTPPGQLGSLTVRVAVGHREQDLRPSDESSWQSEGPTDTLQVRPLVWMQGSKRIFLNTRHRHHRRREKPAHTPGLPQVDRNAKTRDK